jgi:hypothetical protein
VCRNHHRSHQGYRHNCCETEVQACDLRSGFRRTSSLRNTDLSTGFASLFDRSVVRPSIGWVLEADKLFPTPAANDRK